MNDDIKPYIGFAIKSNKILFGQDNILQTKKHIHIIIISNKLADNAKNKINLKAKSNNIPIYSFSEDFFDLLNRTGILAFAITDKSLSRAISEKINNNYKMED